MAGLPSGVVTFVFTDIENSTPLFEALGDSYRPLQERHRVLLRKAWAAHGGHELGTEGDSFFVAFADPVAAIQACVDAQRALLVEPWPVEAQIRVRMGVHTGPAEVVGNNYEALTVHAAARVMSAGSGGQIVVSEATRSLAGGLDCAFVDCGLQILRGLREPVRLFRVQAAGTANDDRPLRTSRVVTSNLPTEPFALVGRNDAVSDLQNLLGAHRLLTITGTGGVGKTRLALASAALAADDFPDGAWFADLHAVRSNDDVVIAVADLLQVGDKDQAVTGVVRAIGAGFVLLMLDNCEHLLEGAANLATAVLRGCPNATVLVTSREPLGLPGELVWRTPSLPIDQSVALLARRIADARGVAPAPEELAGLEAVAQRLDGIPLALELAAARCTALSAADVAARLDERFRLLGGARGSFSRHQTLEAAVSWSVDLLEPSTRAVFRRLAAFAGGWTLDAAEAVVTLGDVDAFAVINALQALVDKSLVNADFTVTPTRYTLLETIRQYGQAELVRSGETAEVNDRHAAYFDELFSRLDAQVPGPSETTAVARADAEFDNLQAALSWCDAIADAATSAHLVARASHAVGLTGRYLEVGMMVERALSAVEAKPDDVPTETRIRVLVASSRVSSSHMHAPAVALERAELAWELARDTPDLSGQLKGTCAGWLATFLGSRGNRDDAFALRETAIELLREFPANRALALAVHGQIMAEHNNDRDRAVPVLERALLLAEDNSSALAAALAREALGFIAAMAGDAERCRSVTAPLTDIAPRLPASTAAETLSNAAHYLISTGNIEEAAAMAALASDIASVSARVEPVLFASYASGSVAAAQGDMRRAELEWAITADVGMRQGHISHAMIGRYRLYWLCSDRGDWALARHLLEEAKPFAFELGWMPKMAWLLMMGHEEVLHGDAATGRSHIEEAIDLVQQNQLEVEVGSVFEHLSDTFFELDRLEDAVRLSAASFAHLTGAEFRTTGSIMRWRRRLQRDAELRAAFPADAYSRLQAEGEQMPLDDARALVAEIGGNS